MASPPTTYQASETPKAGRTPSLPTSELPEESSASTSGVTTPKAGLGEASTSTLSRYSKLSLGFPPFPGFFRSRHSPTTPQASVRLAPDTAEEDLGSDSSVDVSPSSTEAVDAGRIGKAEDDDDRRTIKGVIVDTAEQSVTAGLKLNGNGTASAEEKIPDAASLTVVAGDSFV